MDWGMARRRADGSAPSDLDVELEAALAVTMGGGAVLTLLRRVHGLTRQCLDRLGAAWLLRHGRRRDDGRDRLWLNYGRSGNHTVTIAATIGKRKQRWLLVMQFS